MSATSSGDLYEVHPYMRETIRVWKETHQGKLEWHTSKIVRTPINGVAKRVQCFIKGKLVYDSNKK